MRETATAEATEEPDGPVVGRPHEGSGRVYPYLVVFILGLAYALSYLDRQIVAILAEPIRRDLRLSDTQLGLLIGFSFALFYATLGIPIALLADRTKRVRIVAIACLIWSLMTAACGFAHSFLQFALARVGVGVGEAGGNPPAYSVISDYFPPARRGMAIGIFSLGMPLGMAAGGALAASIAATYGWRDAFFVAALPGVLVSLAIFAGVREPRRGRYDAPVSSERRSSLSDGVLMLFRSPETTALVTASVLATFVMTAIYSWAPSLFIRRMGMTLAEVGAYYSWTLGLATAAGIVLAGLLVDILGRGRDHVYALLAAVTVAASIPVFVVTVCATSWIFALPWYAVTLCLIIINGLAATTLVQNLVPPQHRAAASSVYLFMLNAIGTGGGSLFVGFMSDLTERKLAHASLAYAMLALTPFLVLSALVYLATAQLLRLRAQLALNG